MAEQSQRLTNTSIEYYFGTDRLCFQATDSIKQSTFRLEDGEGSFWLLSNPNSPTVSNSTIEKIHIVFNMSLPQIQEPKDHLAWDVSVVIPAYLGRKTISDCIASVIADCEDLNREIIVVVSSQDGTVEQIRSEYPSVRIIESPLRVSAGQARNIGARAARGKYLFFVDCDCIVPANWFQAFIEELQDQRLGAVGGSVGFRNWNNWSGSAIYFLEFLYHFPSQNPTTLNSRFLLSCNLACRKTVFESFEFYDQTLGEDVMFCHALQEAGLDIAYKPQVQVLHWNREGWGEFFQHNQRMGKSAAEIH
jgi:GT2 family glycosyltransferase